jgi:hypothetical protein
MLATAVLLAACVHDTDDFNLFLPESGASLTYYIGSGAEGGQKGHDDPWDTILEKFDKDSSHTGNKDNDGGDEPGDPWDTIQDKFFRDSNHTGTGNKDNEPDDPWDTISEKFAQETVHTGNENKNGEADDPWDTITEKFGDETVHTGSGNKSDDHDDPWNTIQDNFSTETVHTGKSEEEDPWDRINSLFPLESVHTGKTNDRFFLGFEKSAAVFVSFNYEVSAADRARVTEIRGNVLKLEFADGVVQYVIDAPATWTEGTQLVTGFLDATSKKDRPFLGVRFWRTVKGGQWGPASRDLASEVPTTWPRDYFTSGASLLVGIPSGQKTHDDPWNTIGESFPLESVHTGGGKAHDDPWDSIRENFSVESVHTGSGKSHGDPWDTILESFSPESAHTGKGKLADDPWDTINTGFPLESVHTAKGGASHFMGKPIVKMLFVSLGIEKGEDPWNRINELFPMDKRGAMSLTLVEVRDQVGRFDSANGQSIFAVEIPEGWEPGLVIRGKAYLLDTKTMLPLMGSIVWEVDRNLSDVPKAR